MQLLIVCEIIHAIKPYGSQAELLTQVDMMRHPLLYSTYCKCSVIKRIQVILNCRAEVLPQVILW